MFEDAMWRPNEAVEEDVSNLSGIDPQSKRRRSRRRAWRDGLADQTVVRNVEDVRSYRAFERALVGSVDPRSVIELALAHRLASLLWRLCRASAIETGLFEIQAEFCLDQGRTSPADKVNRGRFITQANDHKIAPGPNGRDDPRAIDQQPLSTTSTRPPPAPRSKSRAIAQCFLRLSDLDPTLLDRAGSYEERLWRQAAQTLWTLDAMRRPPSAPARRPLRKPMVLSFWDAERSRMR
jgi:hypothetical protein